MPMHSDRRRDHRTGRRNSELDWFEEDPWAEPELTALEDGDDDWYPGLWEAGDDDDVLSLKADDESDEWNEEPFDDWGPIRVRRDPGRSR